MDYLGWFVAGSVTYTLIQIKLLPDIVGPTHQELIRRIFEAQNVYSKVDEAKLYPVLKEGDKHENPVLLFANRLNTKRHRKNPARDKLPVERGCRNGG